MPSRNARHLQLELAGSLQQPDLQSFEATQAYLSDPKYLSHFYPEKLLFVKLDASHERGFGIMLFHLKDDTKVTTNLS
jgi:hypothetical protein